MARDFLPRVTGLLFGRVGLGQPPVAAIGLGFELAAFFHSDNPTAEEDKCLIRKFL